MKDERSSQAPEPGDSGQTLDLPAYSTHQKSVVWKHFGIKMRTQNEQQWDSLER